MRRQDVSTGVAVSTLSKAENDQTSLSYDKLPRIREGRDINVTELLSGGGKQPPARTRRRSVTSSANTLLGINDQSGRRAAVHLAM